MGLPCNPLNKFRWFRKWSANYRKFRNSRNVRWDFPVTLWINFVDIVSGLANYRKFRNFRNPRKFGQGLSATLWINYIDFVNGLANYRKFRSFRKLRNHRPECYCLSRHVLAVLCFAMRGIILHRFSFQISDCSRQWIGCCQSNRLMCKVNWCGARNTCFYFIVVVFYSTNKSST